MNLPTVSVTHCVDETEENQALAEMSGPGVLVGLVGEMDIPVGTYALVRVADGGDGNRRAGVVVFQVPDGPHFCCDHEGERMMSLRDEAIEVTGEAVGSYRHWCCPCSCPWINLSPCGPDGPRAGLGLHVNCGWRDCCDDPDHIAEGSR